MKLSIILSAILLTLGWITSSKAQLIEAQPFNSSGTAAFTINLTAAGPINVLAATGGYLSVYVDGNHVANGPNYNGYITVVDYATSTDLAAGSHTITVTGAGGANGAATLIAPNEPPSGATASSAQLQSQITSLQNSESDDATNISYLQSTGTAQGNQISTLQTNEANDATAITALQGQLTTVQSTLQGEIDSNSAAITTLQNRATADETTAAQQQAELTALQNQAGDHSDAITALQQQQVATAAQQQTDEASLAALQTQQANDEAALSTLQAQVAQNQASQAAENTILQNQITALQAKGSSAASTAQINSLQKSLSLTRTLTYAGVGLGVVGLGTGIGVMAADGDFDSGNSTGNNSTSGSSNSSTSTH